MKRRSCRDLAEARSAYVDGYLGEAERQILLAHLSDCSACRHEVAELQRLRSMLTDAGRQTGTNVPSDLANRLAGIADAFPEEPGHRRRVRLLSAAGVAMLLAVITGIGYVAAPREHGGVADPAAAVRADFSATLAELPLTSNAVAAALSIDPGRLRTDRATVPAGPTMTGHAVSRADIAALLQRAGWASSGLRYSGTQSVVAPRDAWSTAALVDIDAVPGRGSQVVVRRLNGVQITQGLVPTPAAARIAGSDLFGALTSGYRLSGIDGGTMLGRPVTLVQAWRSGSSENDTPAARWWIDNRTGLVLRQQTYDPAGRLVLDARYRTIAVGGARAMASASSGGVGVSRDLMAPLTTATFTTGSAGQLSNQGWFCHAELAGMSLARLRANAPAEPGVLHMIYTDGLSTVSVFERRGRLTDPPSESEWDPNLGAYRTDAMLNTATWQSGDAVFTVATDGSTALRDKVVAALPHAQAARRTTMERVRAGWARILHMLG